MVRISSHNLEATIGATTHFTVNSSVSGSITLADANLNDHLDLEVYGFKLPTGPVMVDGKQVATITSLGKTSDPDYHTSGEGEPIGDLNRYRLTITAPDIQTTTINIRNSSVSNVSRANREYTLNYYVKVKDGETLVTKPVNVQKSPLTPGVDAISLIYTNVTYVEGELIQDDNFVVTINIKDEIPAGATITAKVPTDYFVVKKAIPSGQKVELEPDLYLMEGARTNAQGVYQKTTEKVTATVSGDASTVTMVTEGPLRAGTVYRATLRGFYKIKSPETVYNYSQQERVENAIPLGSIRTPAGQELGTNMRGSVIFLVTKNNSSGDVQYKPKKVESNIIVKYLNEQGNPIAQSTRVLGTEGSTYNIEPKQVDGWVFKRVKEGTKSGVYGTEDKTLVFEYKLDYTPFKGLVTTKHTDATGKDIHIPVSQSKTEGDKWETAPVSVANYRLVGEPAQTSGTFGTQNVEVTYVYEYVEPTDCDGLTEMNREKVKEVSIIYKDLCIDNLAEWGAKGFYNVWCVLQKVIDELCRLSKNMPDLSKYLTKQEARDIYQTKLSAGDGISIQNGVVSNTRTVTTYTAGDNITIQNGRISAVVPTPKEVDLSGYVTLAEYNKLKNTLEKIVNNLQNSGAWSGGIEGNFTPNRNIATGNINVFGGTPDGSSFIRTNSGRTENDLAGGI